MPLGVLRDMIRTGGETLTEFIQKEVTPRVNSLREGRRGRPQAPQAGRRAGEPKEFFGSTQSTFQEWQHRIDDRIHQALQAMTSLTSLGVEMQKLSERLDSLEKKLAEHETETEK